MIRPIALLITAAPSIALTAASAQGQAGPLAASVAWYADPVTATAMLALVVFLFVAGRMGAFKAMTSKLDERALNIQKQIDEAKALRQEAAKMMADAERKSKDAEQTAKEIIDRAKIDADNLMKQAKVDLDAKVARREAQAAQRIARAEAEAASAVRRIAADAATKAARDILADKTRAESLFDKALAEIDGRLG